MRHSKRVSPGSRQHPNAFEPLLTDLTGTAETLWRGAETAQTHRYGRVNPKHTAGQKLKASGAFRSSAFGDSFADADVRQPIKKLPGRVMLAVPFQRTDVHKISRLL